jgi:hypothetical protein
MKKIEQQPENQPIKKKGGARIGAGRKPKTPETKCKQVYFYVPTHLIPKFKEKVSEVLDRLLDNI